MWVIYRGESDKMVQRSLQRCLFLILLLGHLVASSFHENKLESRIDRNYSNSNSRSLSHDIVSYIGNCDSPLNSGKRKRPNESAFEKNKKSKEPFDVEEFEEELCQLSYSILEEFVGFFNKNLQDYPSMTDLIVQTVVGLGNLEWIMYLYEEGFKVEFDDESSFIKIVKKACQVELIPLLEYLLENVKNPEKFISDSSLLDKIKKPKRKVALRSFFDKKLEEFRRNFTYEYSRFHVPYQILTSRSSVFCDTYAVAQENETLWYSGRMKLYVSFDAEIGIDFGGLTVEWIELLIEHLFESDPDRIFSRLKPWDIFAHSSSNTPDTTKVLQASRDFTEAFFVANSNGVYVPNTTYIPADFRFVGSILGWAFNFDIPVGVEFLPAIYKILTAEEGDIRMSEQDLRVLDEVVWKNLVSLRELFDIETLGLDYNNMPLSRDNLEDFIGHKAKMFTYEMYKEHLKYLKLGFFPIVNYGKFMDMHLESEQLRQIMRGSQYISVEDFRQNVDVKKLTDSNTHRWIFEIIAEMSEKERLLLFKFITAKRAVPFSGLRNLLMPMSFVSVLGDEFAGHLPIASTCSSCMKFPVYPSKDVLSLKLRQAIETCNTFDLE